MVLGDPSSASRRTRDDSSYYSNISIVLFRVTNQMCIKGSVGEGREDSLILEYLCVHCINNNYLCNCLCETFL